MLFTSYLFLITKSIDIKDPKFADQYQLNDKSQFGKHETEDINIKPVWDLDLTGKDVTIGIIGNGCVLTNEDLENERFLKNLNYNVKDNNDDVTAESPDTTHLLNLAVGSKNDFCTVGAAFEANFFCIKNTELDHHSLATAITNNSEHAHIKLLSQPPACRGQCPSPKHHGHVENAFKEYPNVLFVSPSGNTASDPNYFPVPKFISTLTVSDITANGLLSHWSSYGTAVTVCAPSGGSITKNGKNSHLPGPPSSAEACQDSTNPEGSGAAIVAGAAALLKQKNPNLKPRDISAILSITATKNDPSSSSWVNNGFGLPYSPKYGFGRIDLDLAIKYSNTWEPLGLRNSQSLAFADVDFPETRSGIFEKTAKFVKNEDINFIETVVLEFKAPKDLDLLEIAVQSPSGTKFTVVRPGNVEDSADTLSYTIRGFLGENPEGDWKIFAIKHGYSSKSTISEVTLTIYGTQNLATIIVPEKRIAADFRNNKENIFTEQKIKILRDNNSIRCNTTFKVQLESKKGNNWDIYLRNAENSLSYLDSVTLENTNEFELKVPCLYSNGTYSIYIENHMNQELGKTEIQLTNSDKTYMKAPSVFDTIKVENNKAKFGFQFNSALKEFADGPLEYIVGIYDQAKNSTTFKNVFSHSQITANNFGITMNNIGQGILYLVPLWTRNDGCATTIQTLFFLNDKEEEPSQFKIPLNDQCPVPDGINNKNIEGPNASSRIIWVSLLAGVLVVAMIVALIWHCTCRRKHDLPDSVFDMSTQLLNNNDPNNR